MMLGPGPVLQLPSAMQCWIVVLGEAGFPAGCAVRVGLLCSLHVLFPANALQLGSAGDCCGSSKECKL